MLRNRKVIPSCHGLRLGPVATRHQCSISPALTENTGSHFFPNDTRKTRPDCGETIRLQIATHEEAKRRQEARVCSDFFWSDPRVE